MAGIIGFTTPKLSVSGEMTEKLKTQGIAWNLSNKYTSEDLSAHFTLRNAVLNESYNQGRITQTQFHQIENFRVSFKEQLIKFSVPGTTHMVAIPFEEVTDPTAIKALNYLIGRANSEQFYKRTFPMVGSSSPKSNATGPQPLQPKSAAAKALTRNFDHARQALLPALLAQTPGVGSSRQKVVKRIEHAEFIAYRMREKELPAKIKEKESKVQQLEAAHPQPAGAGRQIALLKGEVQELKKLLKEFETLDIYALTVALAALPVGRYHYDQLEGATQLVQKQVKSDLEQRLPKSLLPWKQNALNQADEAYIKGVAGLMHKSRGEYATYCAKQGMKPERESLEDLILREAIRVSDKREFNESELKSAVSLRGMTPELQTEVSGMFDYLDRLSSVKQYFPDDTRTYTGEDPTALSGEVASRHNSVNMDGRKAPARSILSFIPTGTQAVVGTIGGVGGALVLSNWLGLEPARRIRELGQMVLASPGASVGNLFMAYSGVGQVKNWASRRKELPSLIAGGAILTGIGMYALGTTNPSEILQLAKDHPQYAVALLATAQEVTRMAYGYVCPEIEPETGAYTAEKHRVTNWKRVAGAVALGSAVTYGLVNLYQAMYSENEGERSQAVGFLAGAVDQVWNHSIIAGIALPFVREAVQKRVEGPVGNIASKAVGIFESVAQVGKTYNFATWSWNKVSGYFYQAPEGG